MVTSVSSVTSFPAKKTGGMGESNLLPKEGAICKAVLTAASESVRENVIKNGPFLIMMIINIEKIISYR